MSPSFNSFGSTPSVSQLVWDSDLVIPDGMAIESASGEVGIVGDVSISGNLATDGGISSGGNVSAAENVSATVNLVGANAVISDKQLVIGENVGNASVTLEQLPTSGTAYTSPDYTITNAADNVQYILPPITFEGSTFDSRNLTVNIQGKHANGAYTTLAQIKSTNRWPITTSPTLLPIDCVAIRVTRSSLGGDDNLRITSDLTLSLTPQPIY